MFQVYNWVHDFLGQHFFNLKHPVAPINTNSLHIAFFLMDKLVVKILIDTIEDEYIHVQSFIENFFEDLEQFGLLNFSITWRVNSLDECVDFLLADLTSTIHLLQGSIDEITNLISIQTVAVVSIELGEDCVDGSSELIVCVWHLSGLTCKIRYVGIWTTANC